MDAGLAASSGAIASVSARSADLPAVRPGEPPPVSGVSATLLPVKRMLPAPAARIAGKTAWAATSAPVTSSASSAAKPAGSMAIAGPPTKRLAL